MVHALKVAYLLASPVETPLPSTRVSVLNILSLLRKSGISGEVIFAPKAPEETPDVSTVEESLLRGDFQIAYFQKIRGESVERLVKRLSAIGVKSVFGVCDLVDPVMAELANATIVVTEFLKSLYPADLQHKIHVVHDGIERPEFFKNHYREDRGSKKNPLRAVLVTSAPLTSLPVLGRPPDWLHVDIVGKYAEDRMGRLRYARWNVQSMDGGVARRGHYLRFLLDRRISRKPWSADGVYSDLLAADIGIIPEYRNGMVDRHSGVPHSQMKSENRLTLKMATGLAVLASPIPAYEAIVEQGRNAFLATTYDSWLEKLEILRDPQIRSGIGIRARESVLNEFSIERQAQKLIEVFRALA